MTDAGRAYPIPDTAAKAREPAFLEIGNAGPGEFAFGAVNATMELEYSRSIAFFRWSGFDEGGHSSAIGR